MHGAIIAGKPSSSARDAKTSALPLFELLTLGKKIAESYTLSCSLVIASSAAILVQACMTGVFLVPFLYILPPLLAGSLRCLIRIPGLWSYAPHCPSFRSLCDGPIPRRSHAPVSYCLICLLHVPAFFVLCLLKDRAARGWGNGRDTYL